MHSTSISYTVLYFAVAFSLSCNNIVLQLIIYKRKSQKHSIFSTNENFSPGICVAAHDRY